MPCTTIAAQANNLGIDRATLAQACQLPPDSPTPQNPDPATPTNQTNDTPHDPDEFEDLRNPFANQTTPNLAEAIMLMTQEIRRRDTAPKVASSKEIGRAHV